MTSTLPYYLGGSFNVNGFALYDRLVLLEGITELYIDDVEVDTQALSSVDGSYLYRALSTSVGEHVCHVRYTGSNGVAESTWIPFTVVEATVNVGVTLVSSNPHIGGAWESGESFSLSGQVTVSIKPSDAFAMFYSLDENPGPHLGKPLLSSLISPAQSHTSYGPPFGWVDILENGVKIGDSVRVDDTGKYYWTGLVKRGKNVYTVHYVDHRGSADATNSVTIHPAYPQKLYVVSSFSTPPLTGPQFFTVGEVIRINTDVYSEDQDLVPGTSYKSQVNRGTVTVSVVGVAQPNPVVDANNGDDWLSLFTAPPVTLDGIIRLDMKYSGTPFGVPTSNPVPVPIMHVTVVEPNVNITISQDPDDRGTVAHREVRFYGAATHLDGTPVTSGYIKVMYTSKSSPVQVSPIAGITSIGPDGSWSFETFALEGEQVVQAVLCDEDGNSLPRGGLHGVSPATTFTPVVIPHDAKWRELTNIWKKFPDYMKWRDI